MKNKFAERLKELIEERGFTLKEVADGVHATPMAVSYWARGIKQPTAEKIIELADFFDVSTDFLLGRREDK